MLFPYAMHENISLGECFSPDLSVGLIKKYASNNPRFWGCSDITTETHSHKLFKPDMQIFANKTICLNMI